DRAGLDDEVPAEWLLRLSVGPVDEDRLAVFDADGRGGVGGLQLAAPDELAALPRALREAAVFLAHGALLVFRERRPALLVAVDHQHVLHLSSSVDCSMTRPRGF